MFHAMFGRHHVRFGDLKCPERPFRPRKVRTNDWLPKSRRGCLRLSSAQADANGIRPATSKRSCATSNPASLIQINTPASGAVNATYIPLSASFYEQPVMTGPNDHDEGQPAIIMNLFGRQLRLLLGAIGGRW